MSLKRSYGGSRGAASSAAGASPVEDGLGAGADPAVRRSARRDRGFLVWAGAAAVIGAAAGALVANVATEPTADVEATAGVADPVATAPEDEVRTALEGAAAAPKQEAQAETGAAAAAEAEDPAEAERSGPDAPQVAVDVSIDAALGASEDAAATGLAVALAEAARAASAAQEQAAQEQVIQAQADQDQADQAQATEEPASVSDPAEIVSAQEGEAASDASETAEALEQAARVAAALDQAGLDLTGEGEAGQDLVGEDPVDQERAASDPTGAQSAGQGDAAENGAAPVAGFDAGLLDGGGLGLPPTLGAVEGDGRATGGAVSTVAAALDDDAPKILRASEVAAPPWRRNAAEPADVGDRALLAIVIDDIGPDPARAEAWIALGAPLTLAILPSAPAADGLAARARSAGHDVLLHLPMQPVGPEKPGPDAILAGASAEENLRRLEANLAGFEGFVGVNNHMGSAATADAATMRTVLSALHDRGYLFLDSNTSPNSRAAAVAESLGMPVAENRLFLDNERDPQAIRKRLSQAEAAALRNGAAVAIGHPHPETFAAITEWLATRDEAKIALAPISQVIARQEGE